jgi:hypothetical protein
MVAPSALPTLSRKKRDSTLGRNIIGNIEAPGSYSPAFS